MATDLIQTVHHIKRKQFTKNSLPAGQIIVATRAAFRHFPDTFLNRSTSAFDIANQLADQIGCDHGMAAHGNGF